MARPKLREHKRIHIINPERSPDFADDDERHEDHGANYDFLHLIWTGILIIAAFTVVVGVAILLWLASTLISPAHDLGQWENNDPATRQWFQALLQPDTITNSGGQLNGTSCCGEGDAYWVDVVVEHDKYNGTQIVAVINDPRPDDKLKRIHEDNGTAYVVPTSKIVGEKQRVGNPTGHALLFLGATTMTTEDVGSGMFIGRRERPRPVLCFVDNSSG